MGVCLLIYGCVCVFEGVSGCVCVCGHMSIGALGLVLLRAAARAVRGSRLLPAVSDKQANSGLIHRGETSL